METLAALGGGAFVLVSLGIGLRLVLLARHTGELPEFVVGLALLLLGGLGYPAFSLARGVPDLGALTRVTLGALGMACTVLGSGGIAFFNWKVFRSDSAWAPRLFTLFGTALVGSFVWQAIDPGFLAAAENRGYGLHGLEMVTGAVLAWASIESVAYARKMRRRLALGLADPLVVNRVALWGVTGISSCCINFVSGRTALTGVNVLDDAPTMIFTGILGSTNTLCLFLAFLPPAWYAARIRRRLPQRG
jgi:hypothetical protein